jgi:opacity protein-like surface antigen
VTDSRDWVDGFVGARVLYPVAERWSAVGYLDVGGGGSNLTWQAIAGVNYEFSKTFSAKFGYRYFQVDFEDSDFVYDVALGGFYLGAGIRF